MATGDSRPGIEVLDLVKQFGSVKAVDRVSFAVEAGEIFFLLGPSGCGKTTLLRSVAGFCEPDAGSIRVGGTEITRLPPHERDTGMVFQSYALWPHLTVRDNVAFGLKLRPLDAAEIRRRTDEALALVHMSDRATHMPNQLSGGQQQRVALARALAIRPRCLLLDEPLSNLDAKLRNEMRVEIRRICKQTGLTTIYVTHDQKEALSIGDRLAVLRDGRIEQCGPPREVYRRPVNRFVAGFIGDTNFIEGRFLAAEGDLWRIATDVGELRAAAGGAAPAAGARVTLCLRPEALRLGEVNAPAPDDANRLTGEIHDTVYLGEVAHHTLTLSARGLAPPVELRALETNPTRVVRDDARETAGAWFAPRDAVILPA